MKIALVDPVGGHGGMDFYDYGLAEGLTENGADIYFYTSFKTIKREIKHVKTLFPFGDIWSAHNVFWKLYRLLQGYFKAFQSAKSNNCKVIHLQFFSFNLPNALIVFIMNMFRFNRVLTIHDISSFKDGDNSLLRNYILKSFDKLIVHNQFSYDELVKICSRKKISIIPHGSYHHSISSLKYYPEKSDELNLLFFGQIKKVKGLDILLKALQIALKKDDKINLVVAGKIWHDDKSYYQKLIQTYNLKNKVSCHFRYIPNSEVETFFENSDLVILPYRQIYQSGVLLLAMSYGRAVLTSDLEPFKEIISNGKNGLLFKSENAEDLAQKLIAAARQKSQLSTYVKHANTTLNDTFNWTNIGQQTLKLYSTK